MAAAQLPPELLSLVHYVELNKSGWWDKAFQQIIVTAIWLQGRNLTPEGIKAAIHDTFSVTIEPDRIRSQIEALFESDTLVALPDGSIKISEKSLNELERGLSLAAENEKEAKKLFMEVVERECPGIDTEQCWQQFNEDCLIPLIRELGARTYEIFGIKRDIESAIGSQSFFQHYSSELGKPLRTAILSFLDPQNPAIRTYVLSLLTAHFFLEATNLRDETLNALSIASDGKPVFNVFLDTNFLFSVIGLHEGPSNEAAQSLLELLQRVSNHASWKLYVYPLTVDEVKRVLFAHQRHLEGLRLTPNLIDTIESTEKTDLSSITLRYFQACKATGHQIDSHTYFRPYLMDFNTIIREKGVELYNENIDHYLTKQEVIDDIMERFNYENLPQAQTDRLYKALEHDMVLWHFVRDKRPARIDSPQEANYWVVTNDYTLLGFDAKKRRGSSDEIPVCILPAALIQMLQFWEPRTPEFEQAMLGSLRIPFLVQQFDSESERVTISILKALSRFENVGDLSSRTIANVLMNDAVRQKLAVEENTEEQFTIVRDAIVEEANRTKEELETARKESQSLKTQIDKKDRTVEELREQLTSKQKQLTDEVGRQLQEERELRSATENQLAVSQRELESYKGQSNAQKEASRFLWKWVIAPLAGIIVASVSVGLPLSVFAAPRLWQIGLAVGVLLFLPWMGLTAHQGSKSRIITQRTSFIKFQKVKRRLFLVLGLLSLGIISNAGWDWISAIV